MWRDGLSSLGFLSQALPILSPLNSPSEVPRCLINIVESCGPQESQGLGVFAAVLVQLLGQFLERKVLDSLIFIL